MKKNKPTNYWNIGKIESWLSDMASEGYVLLNIDSNFCEFKEGEPTELSYRIEIATNGKKLSQEQYSKYNKDLWTKVTNYKNFYVFSCPSELLASEPNPSTKELENHLKPIFYKTLLKLFLSILIPFLIIRFLPYISSSSFLLTILRGTVLNITPYALYIWLILSLCINAFYQWKLLKSLSKGVSINHHCPWKKNYWLASVLWNCKIVFIASFLLSPIILSQTLLPHLLQKPLSADTTPVPIVRFEDVEKADGSDFNKALFKDGYYCKGLGLLAPKQIYSYENIYPTKDTYNAIDNEYFELTFPSTQKLIVAALVDTFDKFYNHRNSSKEEYFKTEEIKHEYIDYLIYGANSSPPKEQYIFAAKDGIVLRVRYHGSESKEDLIKTISDFFKTKNNEI